MSYDVYWVKNRAEKIADFEHPTLRVHDTVWRMGFTRALLSTPILQTIS